ncbi:MAG: hypothetical protein AAB074_01510 [Planctomycetota bacterium]
MDSRTRWWLGFVFLACAAEVLADDCPNCRDSLCAEHEAEHAVWDADFEFFKQVARLLGDSGVLEASRGVVDLLKSTSFDLLEVAANNCSGIRTHEVATAVLEAYGRARGLDPKAGKVSVVLLQDWNAITKSDIRAPKGANKEDFDRFMAACRAWLKEHPGDPEGWLK